jgi:RNA polymerase sigma-70 factor (ECF subfamily)
VKIESDESIVRAVQTGDTDAFARLVDRHKERVFAMLVRLTGDSQAAEELAHETFVRAYRGLGGFRGDSSVGTWLVQIAIHLARDRVRERARSKTVSLEALIEREGDATVFAETRPQYDPLAELEGRETTERFETALSELPPSYREAFVLFHLQGMPYEAIAETTGDSVGSLKVRVHRARKLLKEKLFPGAVKLAPEDAVD